MWRLDDELTRRLFERAGAARWQLSTDAFTSFLLASAQRAFAEPPERPRLEQYFATLHLDDLALACACAEGVEAAWDTFVADYRPVLYRAADALDRSGGAREVADSLYGELFGLKSRDGARQSHLRYFHGRSSLATWLRAVLSQRYVDRKRSESRVAPLPEESDAEVAAAPLAGGLTVAALRYLGLLRHLIAAVIAALPVRDRLRLRCYYAQDMTLAEIGKVLNEHEATVSRNLARARRTIREQVERRLRDEQGMSEDEISECFAAVVEDSGPLDLADLLGSEPEPLQSARKRPTIVQGKET